MKIATYRDGSRDGQLVVVSRDGASAHFAAGIAGRLQDALDDWNFVSPQLQDLYDTLNGGKARHAFAFDAQQCMAPLPRAGRRVVPGLDDTPSDDLLGPGDPFPAGLALAPSLGVVMGDVAMGSAPEQALEGVRLLLLGIDGYAPDGDAWRAAVYAPLACTPDELGDLWASGRVSGPTAIRRGDGPAEAVDAADAGAFGEPLAHACHWRRLRAGCIVQAAPLQPRAPGALRVEKAGPAGMSLFGAVAVAG